MDYNTKKIWKHYERGEFKSAYEILCETIESDPEDGGLYALFGWLEMRLNNDCEKAIGFIKEAFKQNCPKQYYHYVYGEYLLRMQRYEQAIIEYERSVKYEPSVIYYVALAQALTSIKDKRALDIWENILKIDPGNCTALLYFASMAVEDEDFSKALDFLKRAEKRKSKKDAQDLLRIGYIYQQLGDYKHALKYLIRAKDKGLQMGGFFYALDIDLQKNEYFNTSIAMCYAVTGDIINALSFISKVKDTESNSKYYDYIQQTLEYCKKQLFYIAGITKAKKIYGAFSIALSIWPNDSQILAYMASYEMELNHDFELAKNYLNNAFEYAKPETELDLLYQIKGRLLYDCLDEKQEGLEYLRKAVSLNPNEFNKEFTAIP